MFRQLPLPSHGLGRPGEQVKDTFLKSAEQWIWTHDLYMRNKCAIHARTDDLSARPCSLKRGERTYKCPLSVVPSFLPYFRALFGHPRNEGKGPVNDPCLWFRSSIRPYHHLGWVRTEEHVRARWNSSSISEFPTKINPNWLPFSLGRYLKNCHVSELAPQSEITPGDGMLGTGVYRTTYVMKIWIDLMQNNIHDHLTNIFIKYFVL